MGYDIRVEPAASRKEKPDAGALGFGTCFTDHMLVMDYEEGKGWHDPRIVPYGPLQLDPSAKALHYGQSVFEGMKAYRAADGRDLLFRPDRNLARLNVSGERLCIPPVDGELALEALKRLVRLDRDWIPDRPGTSLYIRPFIIATQGALGVAPSERYQFIVIMSPVGSYYKEGLRPVGILVEETYVRAVAGGTGHAKTGGNYAAGLKAQQKAADAGCSQVLWLDGVRRRHIEEVGSMNVFFKVAGKVLTPELGGTILDGVTRDSAIRLLEHWGVPVEQRRITIDELVEAYEAGELEEAFGTGTAAVVSPIGLLVWQGRRLELGGGEAGPLSGRLYGELTRIQTGEAPDPFSWTVEV